MKRIGLLSDTHGHIEKDWEKYLDTCDEIWHAGDIGSLKVTDYLQTIKPLRAVYGNIDDQQIRRTFPEYLSFTIEGVQVFMTHIGGYPGRYSRQASQWINQFQPKLFVCGHSHILRVIYDPKYTMLTMNPGAAGISGFHKIITMLRFSIDGDKIKDAEVVELGKRGQTEIL